jgi:hypothetical protein
MDRQRLVIAGVGLAIALVIALGYLFGIQPQLGAASAASDQTASIAAGNQASQATLDKLKKDYANRSQFAGQLTALQRSIPSSPDLDSFLVEVNALAQQTGVTISGVAPTDAVAYAPPAAPSAPTTSPTSGSSSTPTPTPTPAAAAPSAPQAPHTATNPLINASNFIAIPVKISVKGTTAAAILFLGALQRGDRLALVTGFSGSESEATPTGPAGAGAARGAGSAGAGAATGSAGTATYSVDALVYVLATPSQTTPSPKPSSGRPALTPSTPTPTPTPTPSH